MGSEAYFDARLKEMLVRQLGLLKSLENIGRLKRDLLIDFRRWRPNRPWLFRLVSIPCDKKVYAALGLALTECYGRYEAEYEDCEAEIDRALAGKDGRNPKFFSGMSGGVGVKMAEDMKTEDLKKCIEDLKAFLNDGAGIDNRRRDEKVSDDYDDDDEEE